MAAVIYDSIDAFSAVLDRAKARFVESIDVSLNINCTGKSKRNVIQLRGIVMFPHGIGKNKTIAVIADGDNATLALDAGADRVGMDDLISEILTGVVQYDCYIAAPDVVKSIGSVAKVLGPRGLMPNMKSGTVTADFARVIPNIKSGARVEYKADKNNVLNMRIGNAKFTPQQLSDNLRVLLASITDNKPDDANKLEFTSLFVSTTMGTSMRVDLTSINHSSS